MTQTLAILRDPYVQVTYLFITGVAAIYCLIGVWAVTSSRHWFLRAIIPCLALAVLIPIRAHEPLIFYALIMAEIVAALTLWRWWRKDVGQISNRSTDNVESGQVENLSNVGRFRFGLRDLLLLMVVAGVATWIVTGFAGVGLLLEWPGTIVASVLMSALTLVCWRVIAARRKWLTAGLLLVTLASAVAIEVALLGNWMNVSPFLHTGETRRWWQHDAVILSLLYGEFASILLAVLALCAIASSSNIPRAGRVAAGLSLGVAGLIAAVPLASLYWRMTGIPEFPPPLKLADNVYPRVLELGAPLESASPAQAAAIYQQLLPLLDRPGHLSVDLTQIERDPWGNDLLPRAITLRSMGRALDAEVSSLAAQGKHDKAAEFAMAMLKIVEMQSRGGMPVDTLVAHAVEGVSRARLAQLRRDVSPATKRKVMDWLEEFDRQRESPKLLAQRDAAYYSRGMRWLYSLENRLPFEVFFASFGSTADYVGAPGDVEQSLDDSQRRQQASCRLLYTEMAIDLFRQDRGRLPRTLDELVPEFLGATPADPYADLPFVFRIQGDSFILYSVGPDRIDNGGTLQAKGQNIMAQGIDWDLDSLIAP